MSNKDKLKRIIFIADNGTLKITFEKRNEPNKRDILDDKATKYLTNEINGLTEINNEYKVRMLLKTGEVYVLRYNYGCANELNGPHYVVVVVKSPENSPIVTVVPLKSYRPGKRLNPASDIFIGVIPGKENEGPAIAIINQVRSIDKTRLLDYEIVNNIYKAKQRKNKGPEETFVCVHKKRDRLTKDQMEDIRKALLEFFYNGYINHKKKN